MGKKKDEEEKHSRIQMFKGCRTFLVENICQHATSKVVEYCKPMPFGGSHVGSEIILMCNRKNYPISSLDVCLFCDDWE